MRRATGFRIVFLAPAVLLYFTFVVWPFLQTIGSSAYRWRGLSGNKTFVGANNFVQLWNDSNYWQSMRNCLFALLIGGFLLISIGLLIAHALQGQGRLARLARALYLLPNVVSLVAVAIIWQFMLNPSFGLLIGLFKALTIPVPKNGFLATNGTALPSVLAAFVWYALGFYVMLFAAGLKNLDAETMEAADLDGSSGWNKFIKITWPMFWSIKKIALSYVVINVFSIFALVQVMTNGGQPDRHTEMPLTYLYEKGWENTQFSYGITIGVVNLVFAMAASLLVMFWYRKNPEVSK
ncbi:MAG: sugar ABC transporter permease [Fimbriimonadaceae bacterium]